MNNMYETGEVLSKVGKHATIAGCSCFGIIICGIILAIPALFIIGMLFSE